jgi:hypothetical protein
MSIRSSARRMLVQGKVRQVCELIGSSVSKISASGAPSSHQEPRCRPRKESPHRTLGRREWRWAYPQSRTERRAKVPLLRLAQLPGLRTCAVAGRLAVARKRTRRSSRSRGRQARRDRQYRFDCRVPRHRPACSLRRIQGRSRRTHARFGLRGGPPWHPRKCDRAGAD